ncbi:MAG TPA: hypothetical protein VE988_21050 [Gemmataceae bacterium]|nr:hypothetical protein [Gemmataceae bacterium]
MAKLTDPEILTCYCNALANWRYAGYIVFERDAEHGLRRHLPRIMQQDFQEMLFNFVTNEGGEIDQVAETREEWRDHWSHHFDLRPIVDGVKIYVETRLKYSMPEDPDDPVIFVVNIHPA